METDNHPDIDDLRRIRSLSQFDTDQLSALAAILEIETAPKKTELIEYGCVENFSFYLLEGAVINTTRDGVGQVVRSNAKGELFAIAQLRPSMYQVVARETVRFIRIYLDQLTEFAQTIESGNRVSNIEVTIIEQTEEENQLTIQLFRDMMSGNLSLPSLPDVAHRIQQAFSSPKVNVKTISNIIQSDPVITAKLIMISNSALYRGQETIETLRQAIVRLGFDITHKQVMTYAVKDLFRSKTTVMQSQMKTLWRHSQKVASLSRLLAQRLQVFDPEQAQLGGLIHDLGEIAILKYAQQHEDLHRQPETLLRAIHKLRPQITGMLLNQWHFGAEYVTVGEECEDWFRNPADKPDLCDLILIAQYHSFIGTDEMKSLPPIARLPAFGKLGMGNLDVAQIIDFMHQSRDELQVTESLLGAI